MPGTQDRGPVVFETLKGFTCAECGDDSRRWLHKDGERGLCLTCADMDHLEYLPRGDAALTRRATKGSSLSAVVLRWSRSRKQYERQGTLVESEALERAEEQCLADEEARARRRERDADRRADQDRDYLERFAAEIRRLFPACPVSRATAIAGHAAARGSGRVGRTAAAKQLDPQMITLAVVAAIRHEDTAYDRLLMAGHSRDAARQQVAGAVDSVLDSWRSGD